MKVNLPATTVLRPCPLCGGEAFLKTNGDGPPAPRTGSRTQFWVKCNDLDCGVTLNASHDQAEIVKRWNTRAVLAVQPGQSTLQPTVPPLRH